MSSTTGVVRHEVYIYGEHFADYAHVESLQRLQVIYDMLGKTDMARKSPRV